MKLYTINATWVRPNQDNQTQVELSTSFNGKIASILSKYGMDGFTSYQVDGYWMGQPEVSYKIEVATDCTTEVMLEVAEKIRKEFNQDAVILTKPDNSVEFVER